MSRSQRRDPQAGPEAPGTDAWMVVLEVAAGPGVGAFALDDVRAVLARLEGWHPSALWCPDRYAIQLQVSAASAHQAVADAAASHRGAVAGCGLQPAVLTRVEVFSVEELHRSCDVPGSWDVRGSWDVPGSCDVPAEAPLRPSTPASQPVACVEAFVATRRLLMASAVEEVDAIVSQFVADVGGRVVAGPPGACPGQVWVDITLAGEPRHAVADAMSVSGLIVEQSLPVVLSDARTVLARLRSAIADR